MLHVIAFAVIGIVIGAALLWGRQPGHLILGIVGGLIGAFAAGELMSPHQHKELSLVTAVIGALILGFVARLVAGRMAS
jgi:uncharacterized membrane protein YeaQ/YmgE (transglycosylase-associated protein family)